MSSDRGEDEENELNDNGDQGEMQGRTESEKNRNGDRVEGEKKTSNDSEKERNDDFFRISQCAFLIYTNIFKVQQYGTSLKIVQQ